MMYTLARLIRVCKYLDRLFIASAVKQSLKLLTQAILLALKLAFQLKLTIVIWKGWANTFQGDKHSLSDTGI